MCLFGHYGTNFRLGSSGFTRANGLRGMTIFIHFGTPQGPRDSSNTQKCVPSVARCIINQFMDALRSATILTRW